MRLGSQEAGIGGPLCFFMGFDRCIIYQRDPFVLRFSALSSSRPRSSSSNSTIATYTIIIVDTPTALRIRSLAFGVGYFVSVISVRPKVLLLFAFACSPDELSPPFALEISPASLEPPPLVFEFEAVCSFGLGLDLNTRDMLTSLFNARFLLLAAPMLVARSICSCASEIERDRDRERASERDRKETETSRWSG